VVRLIDFYELRLPRRLWPLAMTMFSCVSLRAKRSNLVITCENDYKSKTIGSDSIRYRQRQWRSVEQGGFVKTRPGGLILIAETQ